MVDPAGNFTNRMEKTLSFKVAVVLFLSIVKYSNGQVPMVNQPELLVANGDEATLSCNATFFADENQIQWIKVDFSNFTGSMTCPTESSTTGSGVENVPTGSGFSLLPSGSGLEDSTTTPSSGSGSGSGMSTATSTTTTPSSGSGSGSGMSTATSTTTLPSSESTSISTSTTPTSTTTSTDESPTLPSFLQSGSLAANGSNITFSPVSFGDEGYYVCVVTISTGICYSEATEVTVSPFGNVSVTSNITQASFRDNVTFTCSALGGLNNMFQWQKEGEDLSSESLSTLTLENVDAADGGVYTCVVTNAAGNDSSNITLNISPYFTVQPNDTLTNNGDNQSLICEAEGFPYPAYQWFRSNNQVIRSDVIGDNSSNLLFNLVLFGDEGDYYCTATSNGISVNSTTATLTVSPGGLNVTADPPDVLSFGDNVTFTCSVQGGPDNMFQWQKDGQDVLSESQSTLTLTDVNATDGGLYTCVVNNAAGNDSSNITLYIQPYIVMNPETEIRTMVGESVTFNCEAMSFPTPNYLWEKVDNSSFVSLGQVLSLDNVSFGQEGGYRCVAYNTVGMVNYTAVSDTGVLTISPEGSVSASPSTSNVFVGGNETFTCSSSGGPSNVFTWIRLYDGEIVGNMPVLTVSVAGATNGGVYRCDVVNNAGNDSDTVTLNVGPVIDVPPVPVNATSTESIILSCDASGFPVPSVTWLHNGTELQDDGSRTNITEIVGNRSISSTLMIGMAMRNDTGNYICNVSSPLYTSVASEPALVLVQDRPEQPQAVTAVIIDTRNVVLMWEEPHDNNAPVLGYRVSYNQPAFLGGGGVVVNSSEEMVTITGLRPGVLYGFTVIAFNEIGDSTPSEVAMVNTTEEAPASAPENVMLLVISSTEIRVSWTEVSEINLNGIITMYEVMYEPLMTFGELTPATVNTTNLTIIVDGLEEYVNYSISVRAYTSVGPGPYSEEVTNRTFEDVPATPPRNVQALTQSPTEILVLWLENLPIDRNGEHVLHEVRYEPLTTYGGQIQPMTLNTTVVGNATLTGLQEFTEYNISVRAYTSVGPGPYSEEVTNRTFEDAPASPPESVTLLVLSSTEIRVSWTEVPEIDRNGIITMYEVMYEPLMTFGVLTPATVNTTNRTIIVGGLEEYVNYNISVRAYTSVGPGPYSEEVTNRTFEDVPASSPENIQTEVLSSTEIRVSWTEVPEIDRNGIITMYEVMYEPLMTFGVLTPATVTTTNLTIIVDGLEEYVEYNISVRAYTSVGPGPYSEEVTNRTFEDAPASAPENVMLMVISSTEIQVSWTEVPEIERNGIITMYEVMYDPLMTFDVLTPATVDTTNLTIIVDGLEEYVEYNISVRAYTSVGPGPYSEEVTNRTFEDVPATPPRNVQALTQSPTEILVLWLEDLPIDRNGEHVMHEVRYEPLTTYGGQIQPMTLNTTVVGNATLTGLQEFTEYNISVRAYTSVGPGPYSEEVTNRTFEDVPASSPENIQTEVLSSTEIRVSWTEVPERDRNGIITMYEVLYEPLMTFGELTPATVTTTNLTIIVGGLEEYVEYNISVRAYTSVGPSPYSEEVTNRTFEDAPASAPENVMLVVISSTEIQVSWTEVPEIDRNGIITMYEVMYEPLMTFGELTPATVNTTNLTIIVDGLEEYVEYNISIRAYTSVGPGPYSEEVTNRTFEDVPATPPRNVQALTQSPTEILVLWLEDLPIDRNGEHVMHEVRYEPLTTYGGQIQLMTLNTTVVGNATLTGLQDYTEYNISVRAYTSVGPGPYSEEVTNRTFEDVPASPPENVQTEVLSSTEIRVSWTEVPEIDRNGIITMYEVMYEPLMTFDVLTPATVNTTNFTIIVGGLEEYVEYNISVRAYTSVGPGPYSEEITNRTFEDVPATPPRNVQALTQSPTEILVLWVEDLPIDRNGEHVMHEVRYEPLTTYGGQIQLMTLNTTVVGNATLTGLQEFTEYNISVRAYTSVGPGPYSEEVTNRTFEDVPDSPPENVQADALSSTEIRVSWTEVSEIDRNGIITTYEVMYEPLGVLTPSTVNTTNLTIIVDGLGKYVEYNISVRAYTSVGPGPYSEEITNRTLEDIPGEVAQPPEVPESAITPFTATITWNPPDDPNGQIIQYTVILIIMSSDPMAAARRKRQVSDVDVDCVMGGMESINRDLAVTGNPPPTSLALDGLTPYSVFGFSVQAETSVGPGLFSNSRMFSTPEFVPTQPRNVAVMYLSSTDLQVTWEMPQCDYGVRTGYNIIHEAIQGSLGPLGVQGMLSRFDPNNANTVSVTISQLSFNTNYTITLCARTSVGCGNATVAVGQTDEDAPNAVSNLRIMSSRINSTNRVAVEFTWTAPSERNGLYEYTLAYRASQSLPYPPLRRSQVPDTAVDLDGRLSRYSVTEENGLPFADYTVELLAYNIKRGKSVSSGTVSITMKTIAIEPTEVTDIGATTTSFESVLVEWNLPRFPNSNISHYIIYYTNSSSTQPPPISDAGYTNITTDVAQSSARTVEIIDLTAYTNYSILIRAIGVFNGDLLQGAVVEEILIRTNITKPTAVRDLRAVALSPESIQVTWLPPVSPNGPISNYIVFYMEGSTAQTSENIQNVNYMQESTSGVQTVYNITGLPPYTNYTIQVQTVITESPYVLKGAIENEIVQRTNSTIPPLPTTAPTVVPPVDPTHETISIFIPDPLQIQTGRVVFVAVVVVRNPPEELQTSVYLDAQPFDVESNVDYYITAAWSENDIQAGVVPEMFVVGDGSMTLANGTEYTNGRLNSDTPYVTFVRYEIAPDNEGDNPHLAYSNTVITRTGLPYSPAGLGFGIIIIMIIIVVVVVLAVLIYLRYKRKHRSIYVPGDKFQEISLSDMKEREAAVTIGVIPNPLVSLQHTGTHEPIPVEHFSDHVKNLHANDDYLFTEEYASVEPDHNPTTEATRRPENISKNRYANITSYDHSRVKLQLITGVAGSDYINGNFLDGYRSTNAFIATQGPVPSSIPDFWRMIWEQGTATIVMVTNLEEKGRIKCHKYWPDDNPVVHGDIRIQCQESITLADYTIRTFALNKQGSKEERVLRQFHYTVWPDHGVPEYPSPLLHFVRKVTSTNPTNAGPIVVHCSAGVGRTGTFISLFAQLQQIRVENVVDVFGFVKSMRHRRCFMVQTEPQYILLHDALLEAIECGVTEVPARDLREQYKRLGVVDPDLGMTELSIEFNKLENSIHSHPSKAISTMLTSKKKNRYANESVLPYDKSRCRLSTIPGESGSDYINASHINGYHKRKAFLATQGPLPDTTDDFWRMMCEQNCATIVMLTREREGGRVRCHRYWPDSAAGTYSYVQVILHAVHEYPDYILREFKMVDTRDGSSLPVKQFQYTGWPEQGVPDSGSGLIDLIGQVQKWQRSSGDKPVVVHCSGGTGRTGTFIAVSVLLEKLKTEGVVDVFQTVRTLRLQRPGMVQTADQYEFCYKTVLEFLESFELYSNFK